MQQAQRNRCREKEQKKHMCEIVRKLIHPSAPIIDYFRALLEYYKWLQKRLSVSVSAPKSLVHFKGSIKDPEREMIEAQCHR